MRASRGILGVAAALALGLATAGPAIATPVCTDGYKGGPPAAVCGGRIFPEAALTRGYIQYTEDPTGFSEYRDGIAYLAQKYPRYVQVFSLASKYGKAAVSSGPDRLRALAQGDKDDGRDIWVVKVTDTKVPDKGKDTLLFSLSIHGNERGGLEGGLRTAEDLATGASSGATISDGADNYTSTTGRKAAFHEYKVDDLLAKEAVYFVDFNVDGWAQGDWWSQPDAGGGTPALYDRGNSIGTDLNRHMPTVGSINTSRNPLQENETRYGLDLMKDVADAGKGGLMGYGADIHGELTSQAYTDIMYPAGEFDSVQHRRLMSIAERTKSVVDETLYQGIQDEIEENTGGNDAEGPGENNIPTKPAHWATVWDTLGYTDTGFLGDYMATDLGVTGMDYEIFLNHTVPDKVWNVYLQENHINATRAIIKTAMAYVQTERTEFNADNVVLSTGGGKAGYVVNPDTVNSADGIGRKPGPSANGKGQDGKPVVQKPYSASNMQFFKDEGKLVTGGLDGVASGDVAGGGLAKLDTAVLADAALPRDVHSRAVDADAYYGALKSWVQDGGNLVLTDRGLHALEGMGLVAKGDVKDIKVYQPYANIASFDDPMVAGLRPNARQLVEAAPLGYGIGNSASPMSIVLKTAWDKLSGKTIGTTGNGAGDSDDGTQTSVGEAKLGKGMVRILGGALPTPTETYDHRYGLRDYAPTYTGLYILENSLKHNAPGLG